jgi:hypothetical protein
MKLWKLVLIILAALLLSAAGGVLIGVVANADEPTEPTPMLGDLNGDATIGREDGIILWLMVRGYAFPRHPYDWQALVCGRLDCGDVDGDGYILPSDYVAIMRYVRHEETLPGIGGACMAHEVAAPKSCGGGR